MPITGSPPAAVYTRAINAFTGSDSWVQLDVSGLPIRSVDQDTAANDYADAINQCLFKNGSNLSADIDFNGFKPTDIGVGTARNHFAAVSQVQDGSLTYLGTSSGTNTITASLTPALTSYAAGRLLMFKAGGTNSGAATLNVNSLGAVNLRKGPAGATALDAGDITTGGMYLVMHSGSSTFQLLNPGSQDLTPQPLAELLTEIAALSVDPGADRGLFFDDSAGSIEYFAPTAPLAFSGTSLVIAAASDSADGVIEIAVQSEMETATDVVRAVTPGRQHFHPSAAKIWGYVTVSAGTPTLQSPSRNITSISDAGTGALGVTIATDFSDANYALSLSGSAGAVTCCYSHSSKAAGTFTIIANRTDNGVQIDPSAYDFIGFGDL